MDFALGNSSVLISVFLFIVTMVVVFVLRAADKKNFRLPTIKKMAEKYESEVERSCKSFREEAAETEEKVAKKVTEATSLLDSVDDRIKDISNYSDDMAKLRSAMKTFHDALDGLARLSIDADEKVQQVTSDANRLEEVRKVIEEFRRDMIEADEKLSSHEKRVNELEEASVAKLEKATSTTSSQLEDAILTITKSHNEAVDSASTEIERIYKEKITRVEAAMEGLKASVEKNLANFDERLGTFKRISEILTTGGKEILSNICERSSEMLLASETVESLAQQRDRLEKQIADLSELKRLEEDNIAIARKEFERLSSMAKETSKEPEVKETAEEKIQEKTEEKQDSEDNSVANVFEKHGFENYRKEESEPESKFGEPKFVSYAPVAEPVSDAPSAPEPAEPEKEYYGKEEIVTF